MGAAHGLLALMMGVLVVPDHVAAAAPKLLYRFRHLAAGLA